MLTKDEAARISLKVLIGGLKHIPLEDYYELLEFIEAVGEDNLDDCR